MQKLLHLTLVSLCVLMGTACKDPVSSPQPFTVRVKVPETVSANIIEQGYYNCDHWVEVSASGGAEDARAKLVSLEFRIDYAGDSSFQASLTDRILEFFGTDELVTGESRRSGTLNTGADTNPWAMSMIVTWNELGTTRTGTDSAKTRCE